MPRDEESIFPPEPKRDPRAIRFVLPPEPPTLPPHEVDFMHQYHNLLVACLKEHPANTPGIMLLAMELQRYVWCVAQFVQSNYIASMALHRVSYYSRN